MPGQPTQVLYSVMLWQVCFSFHDLHLVTSCPVPDSVLEVGQAMLLPWGIQGEGTAVLDWVCACTWVCRSGEGTKAYIPIANDDSDSGNYTNHTQRNNSWHYLGQSGTGLFLFDMKHVHIFLGHSTYNCPHLKCAFCICFGSFRIPKPLTQVLRTEHLYLAEIFPLFVPNY